LEKKQETNLKNYAFLAIGYFGAKGTPDTLQKIAIDDVFYMHLKLRLKTRR